MPICYTLSLTMHKWIVRVVNSGLEGYLRCYHVITKLSKGLGAGLEDLATTPHFSQSPTELLSRSFTDEILLQFRPAHLIQL